MNSEIIVEDKEEEKKNVIGSIINSHIKANPNNPTSKHSQDSVPIKTSIK